MARIWCSVIILAAFFLRDLRLLASAGPDRIARACGMYSICSGIYAALLALGFGIARISRPDLVSLSASVWTAGLAIHVMLWLVTWWLSHTKLRNRAWVLALAPSPATLLSECLLVGSLPEIMANSLGLFSIFLFTLIWNALVLPFAYELSHGFAWNRFASAHSLMSVGCLNLFCFFHLLEPGWVVVAVAR